MRVAVFSAREFERSALEDANLNTHELTWIKEPLNSDTSRLANGCEAVIVSDHDDVSAPVLDRLHDLRIRYITTRSSTYDHINVGRAKSLGMVIGRAPCCASQAIAEHTVCMMLTLGRRIKTSQARIRRHDFSGEGLTGMNLHGRTVGIIGLGNTGRKVAEILCGFGCKLLAFDFQTSLEVTNKCKVTYVPLDDLLNQSDIISLHLPLNDKSRHFINKEAIARMKPGVMLINAGSGKVVDTKEVLAAVKDGHIGGFGMDAYENDRDLYAYNATEAQDALLSELIAHPNVLVTPRQGHLTHESLTSIADITFYNLNAWANGFRSENEL